MTPLTINLIVGGSAVLIGYLAHSIFSRIKRVSAESSSRRILEDAKRDAEVTLKEAKLQAKDEVIRAREAFEGETKSRRHELLALDERITQRETNLDRKLTMLDKKEQTLDAKLEAVAEKDQQIVEKQKELHNLIEAEKAKIQEIAHMSEEDARRLIMERMEVELRDEGGAMIRRVQEETQEQAEREARRIITMAIERYAAAQASDITTTAVALPNDEMKGRIIGREGRNIRSIEAETGVDILIDDTPEVVVVSSFDPLRREIARQSLERLIADGRIHPARIEEVVTKVKEETDEAIRVAGEEAIYELGLRSVAPELVRTLGRLKFRHSFSQNVLKHSVEMAHLMGMMAAELGLDPMIAKRVGIFHDLGKALDHQIEGSHAIIGADLLKRHNEDPVVINAVAAHHGEVEPESLYATLATAADAMTASRPGARSETTEIYLKRLEKLEEIATRFRGVEKCFAIQAGREIRVIVEPSKIDDNEAMQMARNISKQVEQELEYPGQIKVTVVRETRCIEYAK
ncbi:MAG: ribonuclease Y [Verrucomicrobia bacterium]|nr:ribonuclease Y [Verrucomicrobiota bacterium]